MPQDQSQPPEITHIFKTDDETLNLPHVLSIQCNASTLENLIKTLVFALKLTKDNNIDDLQINIAGTVTKKEPGSPHPDSKPKT